MNFGISVPRLDSALGDVFAEMGAFYDEIPNESLMKWIRQQKMFFVATAPMNSDGHVNVSPKGHDAFTLVSNNECYYVDITGSGNETISHLNENRRITIMFMAVEGPPRIVRLFGKGKVHERGSEEFERLLPPGEPRRYPGVRAIIWIDIHKVGTSCGYSVPYYEYKKERNTLLDFMDTQELKPGGMTPYWQLKNSSSIDGLPGLTIAEPGAAEPKDRYTLNALEKGKSKTFQAKTKAREQIGSGLGQEMARNMMLLLAVGLVGWLMGVRISIDPELGNEARRRVWGTLAI